VRVFIHAPIVSGVLSFTIRRTGFVPETFLDSAVIAGESAGRIEQRGGCGIGVQTRRRPTPAMVVAVLALIAATSLTITFATRVFSDNASQRVACAFGGYAVVS